MKRWTEKPRYYVYRNKNGDYTLREYVKALEYVYTCFPTKDCHKCPFSIDYSRATRRQFQKKDIHWWCCILDEWILKRRCTKEIILKKLIEVI